MISGPKNSILIFIVLMLQFVSFFTAFAQHNSSKISEKINILWITCEDMSPNLPSFGDSTVMTPHISKLASQGVRYTNVFSTSGVCAPSRSAIITGMYPTAIGTHNMRTGSGKRAGLIDYEAVPPPDVKCFPEYLRANGYYCTNNEKTDYQVGNPFTAWDENGHSAHWRNRPAGQPFFSVFNIMRTHESQIWTHKNKPLRVRPEDVPLPPYYPENEIIRKDIARYYDNIMVMDSMVGVIIKQLAEDNLLDNTIVFFFSDHGAGLPWFKREIYERGLKVPMIIRFPDLRHAGTKQSELVSFVDLAPTVLSLTNTPIPGHLQGKPFLGSKKSDTPRKYIHAARDRMDEWYDLVRAVRDNRYQYIHNYQPEKSYYQDIGYRREMDLMKEIIRLRTEGKLTGITAKWFDAKPVEELYDLKNDPYQLNNIAGNAKYKAVLDTLRSEETEWIKRTRDKGFIAERDLLNSMWPDMIQPATADPILKRRAGRANEIILSLSCETAGASIEYKIGNSKSWTLYTKPFTTTKGKSVTVRSVRYGYKPSVDKVEQL